MHVYLYIQREGGRDPWKEESPMAAQKESFSLDFSILQRVSTKISDSTCSCLATMRTVACLMSFERNES